MVAPPFRSAVKISPILTILSSCYFFLACEMKGEGYATVSVCLRFLSHLGDDVGEAKSD